MSKLFLTALLTVGLATFANGQVIFIDDFSTPNPGGAGFRLNDSGVADGIGARRTVFFGDRSGSELDPLGHWEISDGAFKGTASVGRSVGLSYKKDPIDSFFRYAPSGDYSGLYLKVTLGAGSQAGVLAFTQTTSTQSYRDGRRFSSSPTALSWTQYFNLPAVAEDTTLLLGPELQYGGSRVFLPGAVVLPEWRDTTHTEHQIGSQIGISVDQVTSGISFLPGQSYDGLGPTGGFQGGPGPQFSILDPQLTSGTVVINSISLDPVPEPGTMIALGAAGALFLRRRKKA